jgi:hypothetical protein
MVFAAMAVESFVNYFGVQCLGEKAYVTEFGRSGVERKFRALADRSADLKLADDHEAIHLLRLIMKRRHDLVHPKAREVPPETDPTSWPANPLVDRTARAVADCHRFFEVVAELLPNAQPFLPNPPAA